MGYSFEDTLGHQSLEGRYETDDPDVEEKEEEDELLVEGEDGDDDTEKDEEEM